VLSDWNLDDAPVRAEVLRLGRNSIRRLTPEAAAQA
jgi:hypothetical protein